MNGPLTIYIWPTHYGTRKTLLILTSLLPQLCQLNETEWRWSGGRDNLVTQFDLICGNIYKISLGSTLFFTGYPIGSLLSGLIGDTWGRKVRSN